MTDILWEFSPHNPVFCFWGGSFPGKAPEGQVPGGQVPGGRVPDLFWCWRKVGGTCPPWHLSAWHLSRGNLSAHHRGRGGLVVQISTNVKRLTGSGDKQPTYNMHDLHLMRVHIIQYKLLKIQDFCISHNWARDFQISKCSESFTLRLFILEIHIITSCIYLLFPDRDRIKYE